MSETSYGVSLLALFILLVIAGGVLFAIAAAVKHKRWGLAIGIPVLATTGMMLLLLIGLYPVRQDFGGTPAVVSLPRPTIPEAPRAPLVSDADLLAVAAAPPRIKLGDQPSKAAAESEPTAEVEEFIDLDEVESDEVENPDESDRPDWLDAELQPNQRIFTAGPFTLAPMAWTSPELPNTEFYIWARNQASVRTPDQGSVPPVWWDLARHEIRERTEVATYTERRETSVGTVCLKHTLAQIDDDDREWIAEKAEAWFARKRRQEGLRGVTFGGGALLAGIAILHGFLRSGRRTKTKATASREA